MALVSSLEKRMKTYSEVNSECRHFIIFLDGHKRHEIYELRRRNMVVLSLYSLTRKRLDFRFENMSKASTARR